MHESPSRVVRPIDPGRAVAATDGRPHETRLTDLDVKRVARLFQQSGVLAECRSDPFRRVVEEVQVVAVAHGVGGEVERRAASEIAIGRSRPSYDGEDLRLEVR